MDSSREYLNNERKFDSEMFYEWWRQYVVKFFRLKKIMTVFKGKKFRLISMPAVAVTSNEQVIIVITKYKAFVDGFLLNIFKF